MMYNLVSMPQLDTSLLTAALAGYAHQHAEIEAKIAGIKKQLGRRTSPDATRSPAKRRKMSAAARKRIGDATRKRWAAYRKAQK